MPVKGLSVFFVPVDIDPDRREVKQCGVCGTRMDAKVERCAGGFVEAMAQSKSLYNVHRCRWIGKPWHDEAEQIASEVELTKSPSIRKILAGDVALLCKDGITKETGKVRRKQHA